MAKAFLRGQSGGASPFSFPEYTGDSATYGDKRQGYMVLSSSGTLTFNSDMLLDVFLVGGGGSGAKCLSTVSASSYPGGGSGYTKNLYGRAVVKGSSVSVIIGSGGIAPGSSGQGNNGGYTQFGDSVLDRAGGGYGGNGFDAGSTGGAGGSGGGGRRTSSGVGGAGGTNGGDGSSATTAGGAGQGTTTRPFGGDVAPFDSMQFAGGGGGGGISAGGAGGSGGGGSGGRFNDSQAPAIHGQPGVAGTGGGGGGAGFYNDGEWDGPGSGGTGGSGVCIIRWGYAA